MPRDDLSIDFVVKNMPQTEPLDPSLILDDWINRVQNLPEEIRFMQDEIADKDRQYHECVRMIDDRDAKIQKWIKSNGSHEPNPKEDQLRSQIREQYARADQLAQDKIAMARKLQINMDKHLRNLDIQIKLLYDRAEPGFTDPDEVPSLLRQSAANHTMPTIRASNPAAMVSAVPHNLAPINTSLAAGNNPALARLPSNPQIRQTPVQQVVQQTQHAASAPATPAAASMIMNRHRESSAGPATKRGPRTVTGLGNAPTTSSGLARHSSLGPGTPKNSTPTAPNGVTRAGSAGPRSGPAKTTPGPSSRRGTPTAGIGRKKPPPPKSSLKRVKKLKSRNSPASTADSDLSDVGSGGEDAEGDDAQSGGSPEPDKEEEAEEGEGGGDDKKYCLCHNVSHGDMVACDNENCPYEWFHWTCVGLKSEPNGTWYCPECAEKLKKSK